ncbi:MAG: hypothetical protein ABI197_11510 [Granulicella sp.]
MTSVIKTARTAALTAAIAIAVSLPALAETCTTQSQMTPADRNALAATAKDLAGKMQAGDAAGIHTASVAEVAKDFAAISDVVGNTAPKLKGDSPVVDAVYLLDASTLKPAADGSASEGQFFCTLNRSATEADFLIPALPPGKYAFAVVEMRGSAAPWRLSFLLRQDQGKWLMAGVYPKPTTAAGHDGLWYWTQARQMAKRNEHWNAWLYFRQAEALLVPVDFVQSSHLEKLRSEALAAAPPPLSAGIGPDTPLVVKAKDGAEYRFTSLGVDDSLNASSIDIALHLRVNAITDQAAARKQNIAAMSALLAAYPELRQPFHGIWIFADAPGQAPYATEQAMHDIP